MFISVSVYSMRRLPDPVCATRIPQNMKSVTNALEPSTVKSKEDPLAYAVLAGTANVPLIQIVAQNDG